MGRPISRKYFGNLSVPPTGGEGVASVVLNALGAYTTRPTFVFSAPQVAGGTTATGTITSEANSATIAGTATMAYQAAQVITEPVGGSTWTVATLADTTVLTGVVIAGIAGQFTCSAGTIIQGQSLTISGTLGGTGTITGYSTPTTYYVQATNGTTSFTLCTTYAFAVAGTGGAIVTTAGTPTGLTYTQGSTAGAAATVNLTTRGSYTALTAAGAATSAVVGGGAGQTLTITFRALAVVITNSGGGYTSAPTSTPTQSVSFTSVALTSGRQNAIDVTAWTIAAGASRTGCDIVKQTGSHRFLVTSSDGTAACSLVAATPAAAGQMAIVATDITGTGDYYVTKLTDRKAWLTQKSGSGWEFATGRIVPWNITLAVLNTSVKITTN